MHGSRILLKYECFLLKCGALLAANAVSSSVRLFQFLLGNSFISHLEENPLYSHRLLIKSLSSKLNIIA